MFELSLTEEDDLLRKTSGDFAESRLGPAARDSEGNREVAAAIVSEYRELGMHALELPESLGGSGLPPFGKALVLEQLAGGDAAAVLACDGVGPAIYPLVEMGGVRGASLLEELVGKADARGWVIVDREDALEVTADRVRGRWPWVPAEKLDVLVVLKGNRALVLREGVELEPVKPCALHAAGSAAVAIDAPIAETFESASGAARSEARLRLYAASLLLGVAATSLRYAIEYTKERVTFGRPVAHHQGVAFLIADLACRIDAARLSIWRAAWALEQDGDPTEAAAAAFLDAADTALECGEQGVQLLGGHGYMQDHPVEKWMREARTLAQLWGGRDAALDVLADRVLETSGHVGFAVPSWGKQI